MKKVISTFIAVACVIACAFGLVACDFGEKSNGDKLSVEGYSYVFSYAEVSCNDEELSVMLKTQLENALNGTTIAFLKGGVCTSTQDGVVLNGTYKQTGEKLSVTIDGQSSEMTVTENSIQATNYLNEATVTLVYVKGTGVNKPVQPEKPDKPSGDCKHVYDKYVNLGAEAHVVYCSKCNEKKMEAHKLEDGICLLCGYKDGETPIIPDTPEPPETAEINGVYLTLNSDGESYSVTGINNDDIGEIVIPEKYYNKPITGIGQSAFYGCSSITSIIIPDSVTSIGSSAFRSCSSLTSIYYTGDIAGWCGIDGLSELDNSKVYIGNQKLQDMTSITIPDGVTSIGEKAFSGCSSLTSILIPDGVTSIGEKAFSGCSSLTSILIPDGVTSIGSSAFRGCDKLIQNDNGVQYVDKWVIGCDNSFTTASSTIVALRNDTVGIGHSAFDGCSKLTGITIPNSVTSICDGAFAGSGIVRITIPNSVTSIGIEIFSSCNNIESITVENGNTKYHSSGDCLIDTENKTIIAAGNNCTIPDDGSVTSIGLGLFYNRRITRSITIPDSVTSIGVAAFKKSSITSITIGNGVTSIGGSAFSDCSALERINYTGNIASWCEITGLNYLNLSKVYIGNQKLYDMTSITVPDGVTSIGESAFYGCSNLTSVTIPDSITTIGESAFSYCSNLTSITVPDGVTFIGTWAFGNCSSLTSITIPDSVTSIGNYAFYDCPIETATIPAFACSYINNLSLKTVVITSGESIGYNAFEDCNSLTSLTIGNSVTSIGDYAFVNCSSLTRITFNGTKAQWNAIKKGDGWNENTGNYTVHCTNGNLIKEN